MSFCLKCKRSTCVCHTIQVQEDLQNCDSLQGDLFGLPVDCKNQIPTPRYSSPTSPLSPKEFEQLQHRMEEVNNLIRSLGSNSDPNNKRQLQLHFLSMRGADVILNVLCKDSGTSKIETSKSVKKVHHKDLIRSLRLEKNRINRLNKTIIEIKGKIVTAGRDFIQVNQIGSDVFVLYDRLIYVSRNDCDEGNQAEQELIDVNRIVKKELTFNFGHFVSQRPELVNLFFGIPLYKQLEEFLGRDVIIQTPEEKIVGTLVQIEEGSIQVLTGKEPSKVIPLNDACFVKVFS